MHKYKVGTRFYRKASTGEGSGYVLEIVRHDPSGYELKHHFRGDDGTTNFWSFDSFEHEIREYGMKLIRASLSERLKQIALAE